MSCFLALTNNCPLSIGHKLAAQHVQFLHFCSQRNNGINSKNIYKHIIIEKIKRKLLEINIEFFNTDGNKNLQKNLVINITNISSTALSVKADLNISSANQCF